MVPGWSSGNKLLRDRAQGDVGDGKDHHVGVADRRVGLGEAATGIEGALLAGRGVLDVADVMGTVLQVVGDAHAHLPAGSDEGDLQLLFGHAAWLLR